MKSTTGLLSLIVTGLAVMVAAGCASTPEVEQRFQAGQMDAATTWEAASPWLPADAPAVGTMAGDATFDEAVKAMLPTARPDGQPGATGTVEGLEADLRDEYREMIGFDPTSTHATAWAVTADEQFTAVFFGDYEEPTGLENVDVDGRKAFELPVAGLSTELSLDEIAETAYLMPIDEPRGGMVVTTDRDMLAQQDGLVDEDYDRLFGELSGATFALGAQAGAWGEHLESEQLAGSGVESVLMHYGDTDFGLLAEGDGDELARLDDQVGEVLQEWNDALTQILVDDESHPVIDLVLTYGHHGLTSILGQLDDSVAGDRVDYEVARAEDEDFALAASLGLVGASVAYLQVVERMEDAQEQLEVFDEELEEAPPPGR